MMIRCPWESTEASCAQEISHVVRWVADQTVTESRGLCRSHALGLLSLWAEAHPEAVVILVPLVIPAWDPAKFAQEVEAAPVDPDAVNPEGR